MAGATLYSELFDAALSKLRDYDLASLSQDEIYTILFDYIRPAIVKFKVCRQNLSDRDDLLKQFNMELTDDEIEILSNGIVIAYICANYIKTSLLMKMALPSKDFHAFSQNNQLRGLLSLHKTLTEENEQLISRYSWFGSNLL